MVSRWVALDDGGLSSCKMSLILSRLRTRMVKWNRRLLDLYFGGLGLKSPSPHALDLMEGSPEFKSTNQFVVEGF